MVAWSLPIICATLAAAGLPSVSAIAAAVQRDAAVLGADAAEHRGNLVRREHLVERSAQMPPSSSEVVNRILDGEVNGTVLVGDEKLGEKLFWLEAGCRALLPDTLPGKFAAVGENIGKVQCCRDEPQNNGTYCYRKHMASCLSSNETDMVSFAGAAIACETNGYRLCTKQELADDNMAGNSCCKSGCGIDDALVWTSTFTFKGLKDTNEALKAEMQQVQFDTFKIEQEHKELQSKVEELRSVVNRTEIPPGYVPEPPIEALKKLPIHTITAEEAEAMTRENSRLWYEVQAMRRENDDLKDHIVAIVNSTIVTRPPPPAVQETTTPVPADLGDSDAPIADGTLGERDTMIARMASADVRANLTAEQQKYVEDVTDHGHGAESLADTAHTASTDSAAVVTPAPKKSSTGRNAAVGLSLGLAGASLLVVRDLL